MLLRLATIALLGLSGCSGCGMAGLQDAGTDAARDAGVDAGWDAGRDAGTDAGRDSGPPEGGVGTAGWVRLPGTPDRCPIMQALRPETYYRSEWEPCPERPVGCMREINDHPLPYTGIGSFDGERGYTWITPGIIVDLSGTAIAAWQAPRVTDTTTCSLRIALDGGYAAVYAYFIDHRVPGRDWVGIYHAEIGRIGVPAEPVAVMEEGLPSTPQRLAVSSRLVVAQINPGSFNIAFSVADGRWRGLFGEPVVGSPQRVLAVGDFAYWEDWRRIQRIAFASIDEGPDWLHRADPNAIRKLNSDGENLAWTQVYSDPYRVELWTAPAVVSVADLEPRLVRELDPSVAVQITAMGDGWFAIMYADPQRIVLVELATGRTKTWIAPDLWGITLHSDAPAYVSSVEIGFHARANRTDFFVRLDPRTIPWD